VDVSDLRPTFCELAGAKPASGITIDGRSFAPQLRGETGQPREWVYVQLNDARYVRSERWKLTGTGEFFDMREAPHQQIAVAPDTSDPEAKAARAKLQAALDTLRADSVTADGAMKKRKRKKV
jgi:arylsulfatase A